MEARTIQQQVLIGSNVIFFLTTGQALSGVLTELTREHVIIENEGKKATILLEMIGACQVDQGQEILDTRGTTIAERNHTQSNASEPKPPTAPHDTGADSGERSSTVQMPETSGVETSVRSLDPSLNQSNGDSAKPKELTDSSNPEVIRTLLRIEAKYEARIKVAHLQPEKIDLQFPSDEIEESRRNEARTVWQNIRGIYDYAVKVQELDPKYGRIGRFGYQLAELAEQYPEAHMFKRQAANAAVLAGQIQSALELWRKTAVATHSPGDWKNLAAVALLAQDKDTCCFALGKYHQQVSINEDEAWFDFINLVRECSDYHSLVAVVKSKPTVAAEELNSFYEAGVYLLIKDSRSGLAERYISKTLNVLPSQELVVELLDQFPQKPTEAYNSLATEFDTTMRLRELSRNQQTIGPREKRPRGRLCVGQITHYKQDKAYGFIHGEDGISYFFHKSSVSDSKLLKNFGENPQHNISVRFLAAEGERGPFAYDIEPFRSIEEMSKLAFHYADITEYQKAATEIRHIISLEPDYPDGNDLYAKWQHFAAEKKLREPSLPKGSRFYARAKCADIIEHDRDRAVELYKLAIENNDRTESAVKDLAMALSQLGRTEEAIDILNDYRDHSKEPRSIDGLLMTLYQKTGETEKAIPLLRKRAELATNATKRAQFLLIIANLHLGQQEFDIAENIFRQVLTTQPNNTAAKRHIGICLLKQDRLDEAERVLNDILEQTSDAQSVAVLAAVQQARQGGVPADIDILINTSLSDFFTEISAFTKFFLDHCDYKGVPPDRLQARDFNRMDVEKVEERAAGLGTRLPRDRSSFYLSAAKIDSMLEDSDPNRFSRYLCRSFASMGDAIVLESGMLDSACDMYCEALAVYDNDHSRSRDEQDAANALIRVLYSTLGVNRIPMTTHLSIDEAIESVVGQHPNQSRVFHYIAYLIYRSRYAAARILTRLYRSTWKESALDYLRSEDVEMPGVVKNPDEFARLWDALRRKHFELYRVITNEFRYLTRVEIVPSAIENCGSRIRSIAPSLFFELDRDRSREFLRILDLTLDMCRQTRFEDRERLCLQAESRCRELMREIETSPTKFSIEQLLPVVESLQQKLSTWLEDLYQRSTPSLTLRLAIESYSPDDDRQIEVQVTIENQIGRSPAEGLELVVFQENDQVFSLVKSELRLDGSLRGGDQTIALITLQLLPQAVSAEAFSMTVYVQYRTRSEQEPLVVVENFSIQLASEFEEFENPYRSYTKGGVVLDSQMFYGRGDMINSIAHTLVTSPASKSIVLYGQKRSGKSSILYHLKEALNLNSNVLVLDIENIGIILNEQSPTPLLYQILWSIMRQLQRSVRKRTDCGYSDLGVAFPTDLEFYTHPAPLTFFNDFFEDCKDSMAKLPDWNSTRIVLMIDEFSYIYGYIVRGALSEDFMLNWKAILQRNYFSTVLAGQDVMPQFIKSFPNEWGTTEECQVGYLSNDDAEALVDEPIRIGGKTGESRYREKAIERILDLTAGNPFYIQIICSRLVEQMRSKRQKLATKADVERIRDNLIRGVDALKESDFENLLNSGDTSADAISDDDALQVLRAVARNTQQDSTCARGEIICETEKSIDVILDDLTHRSVIVCERGSYYRIRVGLFKDWLIANS